MALYCNTIARVDARAHSEKYQPIMKVAITNMIAPKMVNIVSKMVKQSICLLYTSDAADE